MASSNIKLFDENKGNMLTDTEFNISAQRLNGLQTGVASSQLQNKAMYQASLVAYAIAQVMMQNGLNANDTDAVSTFVANLSGTMLQKVYDIATTEEAKAGVATGKWMSPALVKAAIDKTLSDNDFLKKSGGTMTGNLAIEKSYPGIFLNNSTLNRSGVIQSDDSDSSLFIRNQKSENNRTQLMLYGEEKSVTEVLSLYLVKNGVGSFYKVLHTGNKPTGSYTGNGSSTLREIDLTNNVDCRGIIIVSTSGYMALVTSQGAIIKQGDDTSVTGLPVEQVNWNDGKIKITSTHEAINKNGEIYYYQCL